MKKKLFALVCAIAILVCTVPTASALAGEQTRAADTLYTLGFIQGTGGDRGYDLTGAASRAAAAVLLVRLAGAESDAKNCVWISGFSDVPAWAENAVNYAAQQGWITGVSATLFGSNRTITANAWCTFLLRMLGYHDKSGDFTVSNAAVFAQHIGLLSKTYQGNLTRGDLFESIYETFFFCYKGTTETVANRLLSNGAISAVTANAVGLLSRQSTARQVADQHTAAVFCLDTYSSQEYVNAATSSGAASGFFISADGLAVTNYHAISGDIAATATLSTGETYPVERVIYYDDAIDLAVIQVSKTSVKNVTTSGFAYLEMVDSSDLQAGDAVYTISNPLGLGLAVSSGVISSVARTLDRYELPCIMDTADISQGSSGGALLNVYGQVIGVTCGAYLYGNGMYLAVPLDPILKADLTVEGWTLSTVAALQATKDSAVKTAS